MCVCVCVILQEDTCEFTNDFWTLDRQLGNRLVVVKVNSVITFMQWKHLSSLLPGIVPEVKIKKNTYKCSSHNRSTEGFLILNAF